MSRTIDTLKDKANQTIDEARRAVRTASDGSAADTVKGLANEAIGALKQGVGKATGNAGMQAEGLVQERKGEAQQALGTLKAAARRAAE